MGKFYGSDAPKVAVEAVTAALESGSIKLLGPSNVSDAPLYAKADAAYLSTLLNELVSKLEIEQQ